MKYLEVLDSVGSKLSSGNVFRQSVRLPSAGYRAGPTSDLKPTKHKRLPFIVTVVAVTCAVFWALHGSDHHPRHRWHKGLPGFRGPIQNVDWIPCRGPDGNTITLDSRYAIKGISFDGATPQPFAGSHSALGIDETWITAAQRYGPYGRISDRDDSTNLVDWDNVNWGELQTICTLRNHDRLGVIPHPVGPHPLGPHPPDHGPHLPGPGPPDVHDDHPPPAPPPVPHRRAPKPPRPHLTGPPRQLLLPTWKDWPRLHSWFHKLEPRAKQRGGRTAIVLRAWSTFEWGDEDLWSLRSLITETALATAGEYQVFILMDVKKEHTKVHPDMWKDRKFYDHLLNSLVPSEFRDITVLFNRDLLKQWYPKVDEYRPEFQMFQPLQLFANSFREYDYFWTIEMDVRFTGHTGSMLRSLEDFAREEPRKQSRQRMSHYFMPSVHETYENFVKSVDQVLDGGDAYYGGVRIPDVPNPIGHRPPFEDPSQDNFEWGVGEEVDFMTFSPCNNVSLHDHWLYRDYINKFKLKGKTPGRIICPVTVSRTSWNLLNEVHKHQLEQGLRISSESTMGSFALWHGLKVSLPPLPMYSRQSHRFSAEDIDKYINGGPPSREHDGMAWGELVYEDDGDGKMFRQHTSIQAFAPTYRYKTPYSQDIWDAWSRGYLSEGEDYDHDALPSIMVKNGEVYLPDTILHPVKTNAHDPKNNEPPAFLKIFGIDEW